MTALPTGTVTLVFTDIESSTRLLHELGDDYDDALATHRRIVREAFERHGGVEVDTQGDAFFFAFPTAPGAVTAASEAQQTLAGGGVAVRMGIHTGAPRVTEQGYVGDDVHRAARIAAAGHGGQVVLSRSTRELVEFDVTPLGSHTLKDFDDPIDLFQLGSAQFAPLRTTSVTNLPRPASSFVGRSDDVEHVRSLFAGDTRLVTVTGPGGSGKTRLAIEAAWRLRPAFEAGAFWVALAPLPEPEFVLDAIGRALGAKSAVADHVGDRSLLLLLDNFEHVIGAAPSISSLLTACSGLRVLVTSRERLRIAGEVEYPVAPLHAAEAVELFCVRAGLPPDADVERLCVALEHLPLAVELAAARAAALSPSAILARLSQRLDLLKGGRDADPRQQTLRATIEWSYDLLAAEERALFARLAVFAGGSTLDAAEVVCDADLDVVAALVDKSLLRRTGERYWMLETIREYGLEQLAESESGPLRTAHARYFLDLAERAEPELTGADQAVWLRRVAEDHENLRAALGHFLAGGDQEAALRLANALVIFWFVRGFYTEGLDWLEHSIAGSQHESRALAKALWGAAFFRLLVGSPDLDELSRGLVLARRLGDGSTTARFLAVDGLLAFFAEDAAQAVVLLEESVAAARDAGDTWCLADSLGTLSSIYPFQGARIDDAKAAGEEGLVLASGHRDLQGIRMALFGLALAHTRSGEFHQARARAGEGLAVSREIGDPWFTSYFLWLLADVAAEQGELSQAREEIEESLAVARELGVPLLLACALEVHGRLALAAGDGEGAEADLREALGLAASGGVPSSYVAAAHVTLARVLSAAGKNDEAASHRDRGVNLARGAGDTWLVTRIEATA